MKVALVSPFPAPDSKRAGMAWYAQSLINGLPLDCEITVLGDKSNETEVEYTEGRVKVRRCWDYNILFPYQIFRELRRSRPDVVHIQHELFLYGSATTAIMFPFLVLMIKLMGIPVIVTAHNGIMSLRDVDDAFLEENGIGGNTTLMKMGLRALLRSIVDSSTYVVVHEEKLQHLLIDDYDCPEGKVKVIHHGIEGAMTHMSNDEGKRRIGLEGRKVILFLGYIAGYKNLELLVESAKYLKTQGWTMIIAGGDHPRMKGTPEYEEYVLALKKRASEVSKDSISFKGFIKTEEMPEYLAAADVLVFPYKACMSASGPLTIAIANERPVLVSSSFKGIVDCEPITFSNQPNDLAAKIDDILTNGMPDEARVYLNGMREERRWSIVSDKTYQLYLLAISSDKKT